jgi:hypothetical protein
MTHVIGTIRRFQTPHFLVIVDALPEDTPVDVDDDGETAAKVDSGEYVHFIARARVIHRDTGAELASDYLGGCIYAQLADFQDHRQCAAYTRKLRAEGSDAVCGSYFADMVHEVITEAREALTAIQGVRVRAPK